MGNRGNRRITEYGALLSIELLLSAAWRVIDRRAGYATESAVFAQAEPFSPADLAPL